MLTDEAFLLEERSTRVQIQRSLLGSLQRDRLSSWDGRLSARVACLGFVAAAATAATVLGFEENKMPSFFSEDINLFELDWVGILFI